jgi:hypothetical protein
VIAGCRPLLIVPTKKRAMKYIARKNKGEM